MSRALVIDLQLLLKEEGERFEKELRDQVPVASGGLRDSVGSDVTTAGPVVSMDIEANESMGFIERGRKPGKQQPPVSAIRSWCVHRGIPVEAAYAIARSIGRKGIAPRPILKQLIERNESSIAEKIQRTLGHHVEVEGFNMIKRLFQVG